MALGWINVLTVVCWAAADAVKNEDSLLFSFRAAALPKMQIVLHILIFAHVFMEGFLCSLNQAPYSSLDAGSKESQSCVTVKSSTSAERSVADVS